MKIGGSRGFYSVGGSCAGGLSQHQLGSRLIDAFVVA